MAMVLLNGSQIATDSSPLQGKHFQDQMNSLSHRWKHVVDSVAAEKEKYVLLVWRLRNKTNFSQHICGISFSVLIYEMKILYCI